MKLRSLSRLRSCFVLWLGLLGSAASMFAQAFVAEWNAAGSGGLGPTGQAFATESGTAFLYVADHPRGRILKLDAATGAVVATLGTQGNGSGQFNQPYGIAIEPTTGDLYVAERGNHRVQRITKTGTFVLAWGGAGAAQGQFSEPIGVALDAAGDIYVSEHGNHRVQKFRVAQSGSTWNATPLAMWGTQGAGNSQLNAPYGLAVDGAGNVLVADGLNGRVQKFSSSGAYQATIGAAGTAAGQLVVATGVTVDASGAIYVTSTNADPQNGAATDANSQWVSKFSPAGAFVSRWGGAYGGGPGQLKLPFSVVLGASNRAYVADYYNSRVQVFDLAAPPATPTPPPSGGSDTTPPAVAAFTVAGATATSVTFQITFSESVTGVNAPDFTVTTTGAATATIGAVAGGGAVYTIPVSFAGTGTLQLRLNAAGTGIADTSGNAIAAGATSPTHPLGAPGAGGGSTSGTTIVGVTVPPNGRYEKNDTLVFTVRFSGPVFVRMADDDQRGDDDDDDDDDDHVPYFTWTAVASGSQHGSDGRVTYRSGSGTDTLAFRLKVHNRDVAPNGIRLGTAIALPAGTQIRDAGNNVLAASALTLAWPQNPLAGVILDAEKENRGRGHRDPEDRIANLSSRLRVTGGDARRSAIAGFVVTGTAPKAILIRAVGPGLASFGIRDGVAAPRLELRDSTGRLIAGNDGWGNSGEIELAGDRVGAFRLPRGSRDAALIVALMPGAYTAQVAANGNGMVLLEIYDATSGAQLTADQIVNISTRGFVDTGDGDLVAGFVIAGRAPKKVLIRGVGPALAGFGLAGVLTDPVLKLYASSSAATTIAQNDNWSTPLAAGSVYTPATAAEITAAATAAGAFPLAAGSKDAALLVTLPPGNYTASVTGTSNGTGAALVEVYEVP